MSDQPGTTRGCLQPHQRLVRCTTLEVSNQTDLHPFLFRSLVMTSNNGLALVCKFDEESKETDFR